MTHRVFIAAIIAARLLSAQLSPPADDSSALLARAREKVLSSTSRLPKYTCLETIDRTYYVAQPKKYFRHPMTEVPAYSCIGIGSNFRSAGYLALDATDRLRMEVAAAGEGEIHAWPGASHFDTRPIDQMISGPFSTGPFGTSLVDVFDNAGAQFNFIGRKTDGGRDVYEYSFHVPPKSSHFSVEAVRGWEITGFSGSFEIDANTAELVQLVVDTDPLLPDTGMCHAKTMMDYDLMAIGDGEFLLPRRSELETFHPDASQNDSVTVFSACHEFMAESSIQFTDRDESSNPVSKSPQLAAALPSGISLTLALMNPIDTRTAAAGDRVSAKVTKSVRDRKSRKILVPGGSIARGRILEMRHQYSTSEFIVSLRYDTIEMNGLVSPLSVRSNHELKPESPRNQRGLKTRATEFGLPPLGIDRKGSWFVVPARRSAYEFPAGFQSKWTTVAQ